MQPAPRVASRPVVQRAGVRARRAAIPVALAIAALFSIATAHAADRVVFQVTDGDEGRWNMVLNNVHNLQQATGPDADIEVVAYGPSVALLKTGSPLAQRIHEAVAGNVKVVVCKNTMAGMKLAESDMLPDVGFVPAGVVEVLRKQQAGYAYIRP